MSEEQEINPVEQEALELGWQPKEDFEADPKNEGKKWRSAEEFMDRKPLFDKIDQQGKELKQVKQALQHLAYQNKKVEHLAYQRALEELKAQKAAALEEGDHAAVVNIDERIVELKTTPPTMEAPQESEPTPEFQQWVDQNKWYVNDKEMRSVADGIGLSLARERVPPQEIMTLVSERIKKIFPDKFNKRVPPGPDSSGTRRSGGGSNVENMLTPAEQRIMNTIVQTGVSKEDYLKQFVAINPERFKGVKL